MGYKDKKYPKPDVFEGKHPGSRVLIIGSGPSTEEIIKYKDKFKSVFDVVIVLNYSFKFFDDVSDYHLVTEKTSKSSLNQVPVWMHQGNYNKNTPRILNWKGIDAYPQELNLHKMVRCEFYLDQFNARKYKNGKQEGLLVGTQSYQNFSLGSSMLCAIHFAAMLGTSELYLIGADFLFKDQYDHWYKDRSYRNPPKGAKAINQHDIVDVECGRKSYKTTAYFRDSAAYIDSLLPTVFKEIGVFDMSGGLLREANTIKMEDVL